jgi:sec-independent protein translocase protein TatC
MNCEPRFFIFSLSFTENPIPFKVERQRLFNSSRLPIEWKVPPQAADLFFSEQPERAAPFTYRIQPGQFIEYSIPVSNPSLFILSPLEGILAAFKVCFWAALSLTSPIWIFVLIRFMAPGLRKEEKALFLPFFFLSLLFMGGGMGTAHLITIPLANHYLEWFNAGMGQNLWSVSHYIDYTFVLFVGHALACELALLLLFLVHFRVLTAEWLITKRRYMIVIAFILGALLTPPDVVTQLLLALPLMGIYELAILYAKIRAYRHKRKCSA